MLRFLIALALAALTIPSAAGADSLPVRDGNGALQNICTRALADGTKAYCFVSPQLISASTGPVTLSASSATQLDQARAGRQYAEFQVEVSPSSPVYICWNASSTCSPTVHDTMIEAGATPGRRYPVAYGFPTAVYYYTIGSGAISMISWTPQ